MDKETIKRLYEQGIPGERLAQMVTDEFNKVISEVNEARRAKEEAAAAKEETLQGARLEVIDSLVDYINALGLLPIELSFSEEETDSLCEILKDLESEIKKPTTKDSIFEQHFNTFLDELVDDYFPTPKRGKRATVPIIEEAMRGGRSVPDTRDESLDADDAIATFLDKIMGTK